MNCVCVFSGCVFVCVLFNVFARCVYDLVYGVVWCCVVVLVCAYVYVCLNCVCACDVLCDVVWFVCFV